MAAEIPLGKGSVTVLASPFGIPAAPVASGVRNEIDKHLAKPFPLLNHARAVIDDLFRRQVLFEAGDGLTVIVCRRAPGEYTVGVANNCLRELPLKLVSRIGPITSL